MVPLLQLVGLRINVAGRVGLDGLERRSATVAGGDGGRGLPSGAGLLIVLDLLPVLLEYDLGCQLGAVAVEEDVAAGGGGGAGAVGVDGGWVGSSAREFGRG